jgi:hypothetical protein
MVPKPSCNYQQPDKQNPIQSTSTRHERMASPIQNRANETCSGCGSVLICWIHLPSFLNGLSRCSDWRARLVNIIQQGITPVEWSELISSLRANQLDSTFGREQSPHSPIAHTRQSPPCSRSKSAPCFRIAQWRWVFGAIRNTKHPEACHNQGDCEVEWQSSQLLFSRC